MLILVVLFHLTVFQADLNLIVNFALINVLPPFIAYNFFVFYAILSRNDTEENFSRHQSLNQALTRNDDTNNIAQ